MTISKEFINFVLMNQKDINGEQETRNSLIEPFFKILGYDINYIEDIRTEFYCDFGIHKEHIDYVLCISNKPKILVEAKNCKYRLNKNCINQLYRYFAASDCKLAILTNGIEYWFFSDFEKENIMDNEPFYKLNILALRKEDNQILNAISKVSQCSYPIEKYIIEKKTERLLENKEKLAELLAINYFHDSKQTDAVFNGILRVF